MPNYVYLELELLERIADPADYGSPQTLKVYAALARAHVMSPRIGEPPIDSAALAGLPSDAYQEGLEQLRMMQLLDETDADTKPLTTARQPYLSWTKAGSGYPSTDQPYIQLADNLFRRQPGIPGGIAGSTFALLTPEQFLLGCLLIQGVRLSVWLGVSPDYVDLDTQPPKIAERLKRTLNYAQVADKPEELLEALMSGDTQIFTKIAVPMQRADDYSTTLTLVPPWDRRDSRTKLEDGGRRNLNRQATAEQENQLVHVLLPTKGYEVSYTRDAGFFAAMHLLPDQHHELKDTLQTHYGTKARAYWRKVATNHYDNRPVDDVLRLLKSYE